MNFHEAVQAMLAGKMVVRPGDDALHFYLKRGQVLSMRSVDGETPHEAAVLLTGEDLTSTDWEILASLPDDGGMS